MGAEDIPRVYNVQPDIVCGGTGAAASSSSVPSSGSACAPQFVVRAQAPDGNCLFRSISDQVYGTPEHHALVRERCSNYIASEKNYFEQFVTEPFEDFLARIRRDGEWGDDVEIEAMSEIYDCRIEIYASYSQRLMRTFHEACDASWPHPIRLQYEGHMHYNALASQTGFLPIVKSLPCHLCAPGVIEDAAIANSRKRQQCGQRRKGAGEADVEETEKHVIDESIRLSRQEFEHKSAAEMDKALDVSRAEWERSEWNQMDEEVVDAIMQQSVLEEEQNQMSIAMRESEEMIAQEQMIPGRSHSSANENGIADSRDVQYPESVYAIMSMGFPLEKCINAYHLVGNNPENILAFCCQTLGR